MTLNDHRVALLASAQAFADACTGEAIRRTVGIDLQPGERYAGLLLNEDGTPSHHVVLLPGEAEEVTWPKACEWASSVGGELPSRREQSLLFANAKRSFQEEWYWSGEARADGSYAWLQFFDDGRQFYGHKSYEGRARAVRRFQHFAPTVLAELAVDTSQLDARAEAHVAEVWRLGALEHGKPAKPAKAKKPGAKKASKP